MSIFEYYFDLLDKPKYLLTEGEDAFLTFFPIIVLAVVTCIISLIAAIVYKIRKE